MSELVHLESSNHIAYITLDSPHNRNALSAQLVAELLGHLATASHQDDVRAVVIRSADRVFCSGADLREALDGAVADGAAAMVRLQRAIVAAPKPVVVRLAGPVRAGGLGIVAAADLVLAAESVTFALTEVRLAVAPVVISLSLIPRLGARAAADVFLTGRSFDARHAAQIGLVTRAVPDAELDQRLNEVLDDLRRGFPQGLRETKKLLSADVLARIDRDGDRVARQSAELFESDEATEAIAALLNRTNP